MRSLMLPDTKKITQLILSKKQDDGTESNVMAKQEAGTDDHMEAKRAIGEDIMHALNTKSPTDLATAIQALMALGDE